jgi:hypothetical protein
VSNTIITTSTTSTTTTQTQASVTPTQTIKTVAVKALLGGSNDLNVNLVPERVAPIFYLTTSTGSTHILPMDRHQKRELNESFGAISKYINERYEDSAGIHIDPFQWTCTYKSTIDGSVKCISLLDLEDKDPENFGPLLDRYKACIRDIFPHSANDLPYTRPGYKGDPTARSGIQRTTPQLRALPHTGSTFAANHLTPALAKFQPSQVHTPTAVQRLGVAEALQRQTVKMTELFERTKKEYEELEAASTKDEVAIAEKRKDLKKLSENYEKNHHIDQFALHYALAAHPVGNATEQELLAKANEVREELIGTLNAQPGSQEERYATYVGGMLIRDPAYYSYYCREHNVPRSRMTVEEERMREIIAFVDGDRAAMNSLKPKQEDYSDALRSELKDSFKDMINNMGHIAATNFPPDANNIDPTYLHTTYPSSFRTGVIDPLNIPQPEAFQEPEQPGVLRSLWNRVVGS